MGGAGSDPAMVVAMLDLATSWRCWCLLKHRDGRLFAGRAGDIRIFGAVMLRLDVPGDAGVAVHIFNTAAVDDVLVVPEREARDALAVMDQPETVRSALARMAAAHRQGGVHDDR